MTRAPLPHTGLPVEEVVEALRSALASPGHAVLQAPPGAGKSTVVPLRLLDEPWLADSRIVVLEPRRLAARAVAARMAWLLGEAVGATVGFTTRDERHVGRRTRVEVVTEGILTRRLQRDPSLAGTGLVILDEVHERNLQSDLALALLLDIRPVLRPDLRLLAMSATVEAERFASVIGGEADPAPIITSTGRIHPVDVRWLPPRPGDRLERSTADTVSRAVREQPDGDVLVFLPGTAAIRRTAGLLTAAGGLPDGFDVFALTGSLSVSDQDAALAPSPPGRRRVVLATDVAETSLTVAGITTVVDAGQVRRPRLDDRSGLSRLHTGSVARSSADQRAGRAGRLGPGVAYRMWSKLEHVARPAFPLPEISSADLAPLALDLAVWGAPTEQLRFLDPPPPRALSDARTLLESLGALDEDGRPTSTGRAMAELPLHPRLARMVVDGVGLGLGWEACLVAAALEDRDVLRGHPDELPVDIGDRVRLIATGDGDASPAPVDRGALRAARRRADVLARRVKIRTSPPSLEATGRVVALAYPDRIAQRRGRNRVRLRSGSGAWLPEGDPLSTEELLVVASLDAGRGEAEARVRLAAALDVADVERAAGVAATTFTTVAWDADRDDLRQRREVRLDALVLGGTEGPADTGADTEAALLERARATGLAVLTWTDAARRLQARAAFARSMDAAHVWPDLSDAALSERLDDWLAPLLAGKVGRGDLERVDVIGALRRMLGWELIPELDRLAPEQISFSGGRSAVVDYSGQSPSVSIRAQDAFGTTVHPTVGDGRVAVVVHLLSPAGRPIQVTADLPGFWTGSWAEVRKEMAGRYPKHAWPVDPG